MFLVVSNDVAIQEEVNELSEVSTDVPVVGSEVKESEKEEVEEEKEEVKLKKGEEESKDGELEEEEAEQTESKEIKPTPTPSTSTPSTQSPTTPPEEEQDEDIPSTTPSDSDITTTPIVVKEEEPIYVDPTESMPVDSSNPSEEPPKEYAEDSSNSPSPSKESSEDSTPDRSPSIRYRPRFGSRFGRVHVSNFPANSSYFPRDHVSDQLVASLIQRTANQERKVLNQLPRELRSRATVINNRVDRLRPLKRIPAGLTQNYLDMTRGNEGTPAKNAAKIRRRSKNSEFLVIRKFRGNVEEREVALTNLTKPRGSERDVTAIMVST